MNGLSQARCKGHRVGADQNLSRIFRQPNSPLRKRIGLRAQFCRRRAALGCKCGLVLARPLLTPMQNDNRSAAVASGLRVLSVTELLRSVRDTLERRFPLAWVRGELSNLSRAPSGHCYFTLKDGAAQVECVMFRSRSAALDWEPRDGMQVEVRALPTLYEPRGRFQLNVEGMRRAGLGPLYERFLRLKEKLGAEGLFDERHKRELPAFPRTIGVVTSLAAAALRDVLTTLSRRCPAIPVVVYPVPVQGEGAAERIA